MRFFDLIAHFELGLGIVALLSIFFLSFVWGLFVPLYSGRCSFGIGELFYFLIFFFFLIRFIQSISNFQFYPCYCSFYVLFFRIYSVGVALHFYMRMEFVLNFCLYCSPRKKNQVLITLSIT